MHSYADDPEPTHKVLIPTSDIFWNYFFQTIEYFPKNLWSTFTPRKITFSNFVNFLWLFDSLDGPPNNIQTT